jgi:hypothetical protein
MLKPFHPQPTPLDDFVSNVVGTMIVLVVFVLVVVLAVRFQARQTKVRQLAQLAADKERRDADAQARWDDLCRRFGVENAAKIYRKELWNDEPEDALFETLGPPIATEDTLKAGKRQLVHKWMRVARNQYAMCVTVEDGRVVGWKLK